MLHPLRVVGIPVSEFGVWRPEVIQAALLHDVLEDRRDLTAAALSARYGRAVASTVGELTKPRRGDRTRDEVNAVYFAALAKSSEQAKIIKLADKLDNTRDAANSPNRAKRIRTRTEARRLFAHLCPTLEDRAVAGRITAVLAADLAAIPGDDERSANA